MLNEPPELSVPDDRGPAEAATPVVFENVRLGYGTGPDVVHGVSAALRGGAVTALLGPNGSGKSTLLRAALGRLRPRGGAVRLHGDDAWAVPPSRRARRVAYLPQQGGAGFAFSVREMVAMGRLHRPDGGHTDAALRACDLDALADRPYPELSGGQQRRVLLARAWAQSQPDRRGDDASMVLLADEPTAGVDLEHLELAMRRLKERAAAGVAVAVVLHDLELAERFADAVWLLDGGRLVASGPPAAVLTPAVLSPVYRVKLERGVGLRVSR